MDTQQDEEQNLSKGGGAPCEPMDIHIHLVSNCVCGRPPAVGLLLIRRLVAGLALQLP